MHSTHWLHLLPGLLLSACAIAPRPDPALGPTCSVLATPYLAADTSFLSHEGRWTLELRRSDSPQTLSRHLTLSGGSRSSTPGLNHVWYDNLAGSLDPAVTPFLSHGPSSRSLNWQRRGDTVTGIWGSTFSILSPGDLTFHAITPTPDSISGSWSQLLTPGCPEGTFILKKAI